MNKNLPDLIEDFLRYLKVQRGRTTLTVRNYRLYLKRFTNWSVISQLSSIVDISREKLRDYRLWLSRQKSLNGNPLSLATQNYHLTALRSFVNYLKQKNFPVLPAASINLTPPQKRKIIYLTETDCLALRQAIKQSGEPALTKYRDQIIIELIINTGLKVSELVSLQKKHFLPENGQLEITKRYSVDKINLSAELKNLLQNYIKTREDQSPYIFVRHDRAADKNPGPLTPRSLQRSLETYRKLAGLKQKITPHTLRHTFAYTLARQGKTPAELQKSLGLKHRATVQIYKPTGNKTIDQNNKIS